MGTACWGSPIVVPFHRRSTGGRQGPGIVFGTSCVSHIPTAGQVCREGGLPVGVAIAKCSLLLLLLNRMRTNKDAGIWKSRVLFKKELLILLNVKGLRQ